MAHKQDYTIRNGLGIRIAGGQTCQVIRKQRGIWREIGRVYELPLRDEDLRWDADGMIPASVISVALRAYELDNPNSSLRQILKAPVHREEYLLVAAS
jgi:hypothetical protein